MATLRRTGTNENVSTYGDGTRDFTSLSTWEATVDVDTTAGGTATTEVLEMFDDSSPYDDQISINGGTHDATYPLIMRAADGHECFGDITSGVRFESTAALDNIAVEDPSCFFFDFGLSVTINAAVSLWVIDIGSTDTLMGALTIYDVVNNGSGAHGGIRNRASGTRLIASIIQDVEHTCVRVTGSGTSGIMYNAVCRDSTGSNNFDTSASDLVAINCLSDNASSSDFAGTYSGSSSNNASSDATAPGSSNRINQTFTFVSATDSHLAAGDAGAQNFGADLSGDATFDFDDDIDKELFNVWDIGADENSPAGGTVPVAMHSYRRRRVA